MCWLAIGTGDLDIGVTIVNTVGWVENTLIVNPPPPATTAQSPSLFGVVHQVSQAMKVATSVAMADVTGDGLMDMLSTSSSDNKVAWYSGIAPRNLDLYGGEQLSVSSNYSTNSSVYAFALADIDLDGDVDVIWGGTPHGCSATATLHVDPIELLCC